MVKNQFDFSSMPVSYTDIYRAFFKLLKRKLFLCDKLSYNLPRRPHRNYKCHMTLTTQSVKSMTREVRLIVSLKLDFYSVWHLH